MNFSFFTTPHHEYGQRSLEDVIGIFGHQLRALGHVALNDPRNANWETAFVKTESDWMNVFVEGFTPSWIEVMRRFKLAGARMMILATEEPTPKGFNWGRDREMRMRQELFPQAAQYCEGILHLVPGKHVTDWYSQFAPAAQAELGYAPKLERADLQFRPDYEFGFYGSVTPRRKKLLKELANLSGSVKGVRVIGDFRSQAERDREMRRAKVIIQIRKFEEMGLVSSSRCNTALMIGRPVVAEPHDLVKPWNEVIDFPDTKQQFLSQALFARASWYHLWRTQLERFKAKMSPAFCVGDPLRQIGILDRARAA